MDVEEDMKSGERETVCEYERKNEGERNIKSSGSTKHVARSTSGLGAFSIST